MFNVRINSPYYSNSAPAEAQTTNLQHKKQAAQQSAGEPHPPVPPANDVSTTHKGAHTEQHSTNPRTNEKPETERPQPVAVTEGEGESVKTATAQAFVSFCESDTMLVARVLIAGELQTAHLDSCASHCFVSSAMSQHLTEIGNPPVTSPVSFEVKQGNPLCDTDLIHFAPLSIVLESGAICTWDNCLFLVADAGAPIILCYSLLRLGGILSYEPPHGYERMLKRAAGVATAIALSSTSRSGTQAQHFATMRGGTYYHAPSSTTPPIAPHQLPAKCLATDAEGNHCPSMMSASTISTGMQFKKMGTPPDNSETEILLFDQEKSTRASSPSPPNGPTDTAEFLYPKSEQNSVKSECGKISDEEGSYMNPLSREKDVTAARAFNTSSSTTPPPATKKRKGETDMLTPENPYGKNPPLPEEVLEAMNHLKLLSNPKTAPSYTASQVEEIRRRFQEDRPRWANCLTLDQTLDVSDKETEQFLYDLMDKPKYQNSIFSSNLSKCCDLGEYELNQFPGRDLWAPPQPCRYKNPVMAKIVDDWLDFLLANNKARESTATHPARVTIVHKESREPRVCVDYRNRNARTEVPIFPMPDLGEFLDDNSGFKYYCSFDMAKMFNQFRLKEAHKHLAAFITPRGVYEPNVVLFGLAGGPQHAVREAGGAMAKDPLTNGIKFTEWALEQNANGVQPPYPICPSTKVVPGSRLKPFIDDVTVPSNHIEGMKKLVEFFFEFCFKHNLILSRKKAQIMKTHLRMLGFVVSEKGKHLDPHRIVSLLEADKPRSKETLHAMLSSYTFIRMFIPNFASIAAPLYEATKGIVWKGPLSGKAQGIRQVDPLFVWTPEMTRAYEQLRNALLEAPILQKVDWNYPLFLSVDASIRGEGWVLWQLLKTADGVNVAVAIKFGSKKYDESQSNWETTRQEASAIKSALTDVYDYVFGQHFYVFSDHLNLRYMHNSINRAVIRMRDFLSQFIMTVVHCPGIWNNADSISRLEHPILANQAKNLNSSTTAKLTGQSLYVSVGTSTNEDEPSEGTLMEVHTYQRLSLDSAESPTAKTLRTQATVCTLRSQATVPVSACCLLCEVNHPSPDGFAHETDWNVAQTNAPVRETPTNQNAEGDGDTDNLLSELSVHWAQSHNIELATLRREASVWNTKVESDPKLGIPLLWRESEIHQPEDEEDLDDLDWCGTVDRTAVSLRTPVSARFRGLPEDLVLPTQAIEQLPFELQHVQPEQMSPLKITTAKSPAKRKVTFQEPLTDNSHEVRPAGTMLDAILNAPSIHEIIEKGTQTTPADFRIALIRTPLTDDFKAIHNNESGHHGLDFSYRKLLKRCGSKWANERGEATKIKVQLKRYLDACPICQKVRGLRDKVKAKHSFIVSRPFLEVSYDFIVFKTEDKNGNRYLIVAIDNFLKIVEIKPVKNRDAETVTRFLLEIGARYGHMARLRFDNEKAFTGLLVSKLNEVRGTEEQPCIPYHPQANSVCERQNGIIMEHLNALILGCKLGPESKVAWSDLVPFVFSLVNNTPKNPLGISPLSMLYGVFANYDQPLLPTMQANDLGTTTNPVDYLEALMAWQNQLLDITEKNQSDHFTKMEDRFNRADRVRQFNVGDFVLQQKSATKISGKPGTRWVGPFLVMDRRNNDPSFPVLDLMNLTDMRIKTASIEDCRIFNTTWFDEANLLPELTKLAAIDENEYVVEKIISHKPMVRRGRLPLSKFLFEVKWQDFETTTWEPYSGLKNLEPLESYARLHPELNIPIPTSTSN